jgi:hypothetical protein
MSVARMVVIRRFGVSDPESVHLEAQRGLRELDKPSDALDRYDCGRLLRRRPSRSGPRGHRVRPRVDVNRSRLGVLDRRTTGGPHWGVRTARTMLGGTAGNRPGAAAPRDPARLRCATFVCRQEGPTPTGVTLTFRERKAMRAWRPDAARQSPHSVRPAVLCAHQRDSGCGVNLRCLHRPSERRT